MPLPDEVKCYGNAQPDEVKCYGNAPTWWS